MSSHRLLVLHGFGDHGRVVAHSAMLDGWHVKFTDQVDGTIPKPGDLCHISIGDNAIRKKLFNEIKAAGRATFVTVTHPSATVSSSARIYDGTFVGAGALVNIAAKIGVSCIVNTGALVEHDCVIGDFCHLSPNATLCGTVTLGEGVWIGANATIKNNVKIAAWVTIGCGAVVVEDITEPGTYVGNPARRIK